MRKLTLLIIGIIFIIPSLVQSGVGLGLKGGILKDSKADEYSDNMAMVGGDLRLSGLPMLDFIVSGEYSWKKYTGNEFPVEAKLSILSITGSAVYPIKMPLISPYAGAGFGSHTVKTEIGDLSGSATKTGFHIIGGVSLGPPGSPLKVYGEYRHYWINLEEYTGKYNTFAGGVILGGL